MNNSEQTRNSGTGEQESIATRSAAWKTILFYAVLLLAGFLLNLLPLVGVLAGLVAGMLAGYRQRPSPQEAVQRGFVAGLVTVGGELIAFVVMRNEMYAGYEDIGVMIFGITAIATVALAVWLSRLIAKPRPPAVPIAPATTAAVSQTKRVVGRDRPIRDLEYQPLMPSNGYITVVCRSCRTKQQIPIAVFSTSTGMSRQQLTVAENQIQITDSGQHFYDTSHLSKGAATTWGCLVWLLAAAVSNWIIGLVGGGDIVVYVVWNLSLVVVLRAVSKPLTYLVGRKMPIWLISCSKCSAKTPVATDGNKFFTAGTS